MGTLILDVAALDGEGGGIARGEEGKVVFVQGALPGERVEALRLTRKPSFDVARTVRVIRASAARRVPPCEHFGTCGGCVLQHAESRLQVAAKQRELEDALERIGRVRAEAMLPAIHGEEWGYRRRARFSARFVVKKASAFVGFRERRSSFVADMQSCAVLPPAISALLPKLRALVGALSIRERMPQIELAAGDDTTVLVFRHLVPLSEEDACLLREFADRERVWIWLQASGPDSAEPFHPPEGTLSYRLPEFGLVFSFRPTEFTQVNFGVNRVLVSRAVRLLDPRPGERIADMFCGLGNFGLAIARSGATVSGFEGSPGLVLRAQQNAAANGLRGNAGFAVADLFRIDEPALRALGPFDGMLLDPPREGATELVKSIPVEWPSRIVYVSCDPATLARDAGVLVNVKGFRLTDAGVVNMFPHTAHVESIAVFRRAGRPGA